MLSPIELIDIAQALASRIPSSPEYTDERNIAWLAVGRAWLELNDIVKAGGALQHLDDPECEATLRVQAAKWSKAHPSSDVGRHLLQETVSRVPILENHLSRKDITEMAPAVLAVLGLNSIHPMAAGLSDPFAASNLYVEVSAHAPDTRTKREHLLMAETFAAQVGGDRDYALRWIFRGYQFAGLLEDAERIRLLAKIDPDSLTARENALFEDVHEVLNKVGDLRPKAPVDTQAARLRRFLEYRMNDLKVIFLADACRAGGISEPEIEGTIRGEAFRAIERPRPWLLGRDTSQLDEEGIARFFFDRPICRNDADRELLFGEGCPAPDPKRFVGQVTGLFQNFARLTRAYSMAQVEQGLWLLLSYPFWFPELMNQEPVQSLAREKCMKSMIHPFREYLLPLDDRFEGTVFYMWWDLMLDRFDEQSWAAVEPEVLTVLREILRLPGKACQFAALHGLNHLHPSPEAADEVRQFLKEHRASLTDEEVAWIEQCAEGAAL